MPLCCCFGRRSPRRSSRRRHQGAASDAAGKSKNDELQSPLSCNSFVSEYYDAQEFFASPEATSPPCSNGATPRYSGGVDRHHEQLPPQIPYMGADAPLGVGAGSHANPRPSSAASATAATALTPVGPMDSGKGLSAISVSLDSAGCEIMPQSGTYLAGTSDTSEDTLQSGAGPMGRLAGCLSILENIRIPTVTIPGAGGSAGAGGAGSSGGGLLSGSPQHGSPAGGAADGAGGGAGGRPRARRLSGKLEPGCTLARRDMSQSISEVREAWDPCDEDASCGSLSGGGAGGYAPSTSGRPFMVRGMDYMRTKVKVPSRGALYRLLAADVISSETKLAHVARMANLQHLHRPAVDPQLPPLLVITIMLPMYPASFFGANDGPNQSLVYYFGLPPDFNPATYANQTALALLRRFVANGREVDGSPTRDRFKLIPRVVNVDEWAAKGPLSPAEHKLLASYNDKPILTRPQHYFFHGPGYLEVDIDIHTYQFLARKALCAYLNRLKEVIFENAFVIQGNIPDELPEQVIAAVRMYRVDLQRNRALRDYMTPPGMPPAHAMAHHGFVASTASYPGNGDNVRPLLQGQPSMPPAIPETPEEQE